MPGCLEQAPDHHPLFLRLLFGITFALCRCAYMPLKVRSMTSWCAMWSFRNQSSHQPKWRRLRTSMRNLLSCPGFEHGFCDPNAILQPLDSLKLSYTRVIVWPDDRRLTRSQWDLQDNEPSKNYATVINEISRRKKTFNDMFHCHLDHSSLNLPSRFLIRNIQNCPYEPNWFCADTSQRHVWWKQ